MKIILLTLVLFPIACFSQTISQEGIWKGYPVMDTEGNEINYKRQDFVKIKDNSLLLFQFKELVSMENGEVVIKTVIDTFSFEPSISNPIYTFQNRSEYLKIKNDREFQIIYPDYVLTFKKIKNLKESNNTFKQFEDFIIGNNLIEANPLTNEVVGNLSKTYQEEGKVKYKKIDSKSNWESEYKIIDFEGFTFLKGISSAPIILKNIAGDMLNGIEVDYRFKPKKISLGKLDQLIRKNISNTEKPFLIELTEESNEECISQLADSLLNHKINIAKGITEKKLTTIQVQHSYECNWMLFHEEKFDGFGKASIKDLLKMDSTLCQVIKIPCGYYAERDSKVDKWHVYLHEERIETDSSYIFKKVFTWDNTYRVINEIKNKDIVYYQDYHLDTRALKKTWTFREGKEIGITRFYNKEGKLIREIEN